MKKGERSLATIINKIGHQFDSDFSGLTIYLYHSSLKVVLYILFVYSLMTFLTSLLLVNRTQGKKI